MVSGVGRGFRRFLAGAALAVSAVVLAPERGLAWTLRDPWPSSAAELAGIAAQEVSFPSSSPFTPADAGPSAEPATALGYLYLPRTGGAQKRSVRGTSRTTRW